MLHTFRRALVITVMTTVITGAARFCVFAQNGGSWYAHKGYSIEEVLVADSGAYVVIVRSQQAEYGLLTPENPGNGVFQVAAVGSEQVRLREAGNRVPILLPILHRNIPLDILTLAVCMLNGKQVVLSAPIEEVLAEYKPSEYGYREELGIKLEQQGCSIVVYDDVAVVGKGLATGLPHHFNGAAGDGRAVAVTAVRRPLSEIITKLEAASGLEFEYTADGTTPVTVYSRDLTPLSMIHYLNGILSAGIKVKSPPAAVTDLPVAPSATVKKGIDRQRADRIFRKIVLMARKGRTRRAARLCLRLIKKADRPSARYYNLFGRLCWKLGARRRAVKSFRLALKADPENHYARKTLQAIARKIKKRSAHS